MPQNRVLLRFVLILALTYAGFLGIMAIPGVTEDYARAARGLLNSVFRSFRPTGLVQFEPNSPGDRMDTVVNLRVRGRKVKGTGAIDMRVAGYLPAAETCALILETPIPLRRKLWALVTGLTLCHLMLLARLWCALADWFASQPEWGVIQVGDTGRRLLVHLHEFATISPALSFIWPVFAWIIVCVRYSDLQRWFPQAGHSSHVVPKQRRGRTGGESRKRKRRPKRP